MFDVEEVRKDFPILSIKAHGHPLVYLDNAATMQVPEPVLAAVLQHYRTSNANVHRGMHYLAHASTDALEQARKTVACFVGISDERNVVFTRGATDALNMAAAGLAHLVRPGDRVVVSVMEHHSNLVPWQQLCQARDAELCVVDVDEAGNLDIEEFSHLLDGMPQRSAHDGGTVHAGETRDESTGNRHGPVRIVALTGCSNVTGAVNPVRALANRAHAAGALFVLDGAQIMRHGTVDVEALGCDLMAFSGHKMLAGTGLGVLCGTAQALDLLQPRDFGGEMVGVVAADQATWEDLPLRLEAGTPNYVGAVALARACDYLTALGREDVDVYEDELVSQAVAQLSDIDGLSIIGNPDKRGGVVSFTVDGIHPFDLCTLVDARGVALRSGHNCAQPLLARFGLTSVARMSPAFYNTPAEISYACAQVAAAARLLKRAR